MFLKSDLTRSRKLLPEVSNEIIIKQLSQEISTYSLSISKDIILISGVF